MKPDVTELMLKDPLPFWVDPSGKEFFFSRKEREQGARESVAATASPPTLIKQDWLESVSQELVSRYATFCLLWGEEIQTLVDIFTQVPEKHKSSVENPN